MAIRDSLLYLMRGPGTSSFRSPLTTDLRSVTETVAPLRTSWVFDSHIEESSKVASKPQATSVAWDERESKSISDSISSWAGLSARERKEILLSIYLSDPWISAPIDVIANRIASGGYVIEEVEKGKGSPKNYDTLNEFILRINPDWDFLQLTRSSIQDILTFGETFTEMTWANGVPWQLFLVDCITMRTKTDRTGNAIAYIQQLENVSQRNYLDPKNIIRWWRPHPKAKVDPFSPIEKVQDAVLAEAKMVRWMQTFFQKGAKYPYYIQGGPGFDLKEAERYKVWYEANYTGEKNAHIPPITYGDTKIVPLGKGSIDIDFEHGRDRTRLEKIAAFHVPPAALSIIESGSIGGGTGEDQDKSLQYNACDPIKQLFFEKFNFRIVRQGFGIHDWRISTKYADFRNDKDLAEVQDKRMRNGTRTINELRQEDGKQPYEGYGGVPVIVTTKEITPVPRLEDLEDESRQTAQAAIQTAQANADLADTKAKQAKEPPPEPKPEPEPPSPDGTPAPKAAQPPAPNTAPVPTVKTPPLATSAKSESALQWENDKKLIMTAANDAYGSSLMTAEDWLHITHLMEERHVEQTTHPQSETSHALASSADTQTSDRPVHPLLPAMETGQDHATGMMLAFMLDKETAKQLAIPGGETVDNLHITLAYLGDTDDAVDDDLLRPHTSPFKIRDAIRMITSQAKPLSGSVGGIGRFFPAETDTTPVIAMVDVPGLVEFRTKLVQVVQAAGYFVADNHGYTPHITLDYIPADAAMPIETVPPLPLTLDTVTLCIGEKQETFKLGESAKKAQQESGMITLNPLDGPLQKRIPMRKVAEDTQSQSESDKRKAELAIALLALFLAMQRRGSAALTSLSGALLAYSFTSDEKQSFIKELAEAYLWGQMWAFTRAFTNVGMRPPAVASLFTFTDALSWATGQVSGIFDTFSGMLSNFVGTLPHDLPVDEATTALDGFITQYSSYKPQQIANYTVGVGVNEGARTATSDMLDALTNVGVDTSGIPDGLDAANIRVRVVPSTSSSDMCSEWAGRNFPLADAGDIPYFPAHSNCPHSIEVYIDDGGDADANA